MTVSIKCYYRLCKRHGVTSPVCAPSLHDPKHINVLGKGVEKIKDELVSSEFSFTTIESGPLHTEQHSLPVVKREADQNTEGWNEVRTATCGLILQGTEMNKDVPLPPGEALYVVVPAHLILSQAQCDQLVAEEHPKSIEEIRQEVNSKIDNFRYALEANNANNNETNKDLKQPAMISYRHYYKNVEKSTHDPGEENADGDPGWTCSAGKCSFADRFRCPHPFMNDIALLPIDQRHQLREQLNQDVEGLTDMQYNNVLSTKSVEAICREEDVYVGNRRCQLVSPYETPTECAERTCGEFVAFALEHEG